MKGRVLVHCVSGESGKGIVHFMLTLVVSCVL